MKFLNNLPEEKRNLVLSRFKTIDTSVFSESELSDLASQILRSSESTKKSVTVASLEKVEADGLSFGGVAKDEVLCCVADNLLVRFSPSSLVVTPLKL